MSDIANHPLLHLVEAETKSLILQAEEFDRQEAADRQTAAMRIAADAEATIAADANAIEDMDPPLADELGVDISGLGDKRGALVRFAAWFASLEKRLDLTTKGRAVFLEQLGVAAVTEKALADLVASDKSRLLAWMQSGASLTRPTIREFERQQLASKLVEDTYEVQTTKAAIEAADHEIDVLTRQIGILRTRHRSFVLAAVLEHAGLEGAGPAYMLAIKNLEDRLAEMLGLATILGGHSGFYRSMRDSIDARIDLPRFALPGAVGHLSETMMTGTTGAPSIEVSAARASAAAGPWRDLVKLWTTNPLAQPATQQEK